MAVKQRMFESIDEYIIIFKCLTAWLEVIDCFLLFVGLGLSPGILTVTRFLLSLLVVAAAIAAMAEASSPSEFLPLLNLRNTAMTVGEKIELTHKSVRTSTRPIINTS